MRLSFLLVIFLFPLVIFADDDPEAIEQRIRPVGQVNIEEMKADNPTIATKDPVKTPDNSNPGKTTYEKFCVICHGSGLAGAPKFRNSDDWQARLSGQNIDALTASAMQGKNAMPPKGTCAECNDKDIKMAIEYMVPQ